MRRLVRAWPWWLFLALVWAAVWHVVHFPADVDQEFPRVARPTFSPLPPPAYRLAEPGDTIDRVAIYFSSLALVLALSGLIFDDSPSRRWLAALLASATAFWYAANPSPTFDGWHGLGWSVMFDESAPVSLRLALAVALAAALVAVVACLWPDGGLRLVRLAAETRAASLGAGVVVLTLLRLSGLPSVEPIGYWPRWAFAGALLLYCAALVRCQDLTNLNRRRAVLGWAGAGALWYALVVGGIWLTWYHRPLERFRELVPGKIFISAMPTYRGLELAHGRHGFKTIINLFPEATPLQSPRFPEEQRFVREQGLRYVGSPANPATSNAFLDLTLDLATDPNAWPILVHCHGCMDRTPAWAGIYQFVVEGRPLVESLQFIEQHRGYRPKASVTLLYNRTLPRLAPERARNDPTAALLKQCAGDVIDGSYDHVVQIPLPAGSTDTSTEVGRTSMGLLPSLTPRR